MLLAARNLSMLCVPEGVSVVIHLDELYAYIHSQGMNYDWDQTYIVDGMHV